MLNAFIGVFGTGGWWGRIDTSSSVPEISACNSSRLGNCGNQ